MANFLDLDKLFALFGKPGETLNSEWQEAILRSIRENGRPVASHENFGVWPGRTVIYLFEGLYFAEYKTMHGPFETFHDAARAIHFFYITEASPSAWIASEVLTTFQLPSHWKVVRTNDQRTVISPMPPDADGWFPTGGEETPLAEMARELEEKWRAQGIIVTHAAPPVGPQPLVATFHRAKNASPKRPDSFPMLYVVYVSVADWDVGALGDYPIFETAPSLEQTMMILNRLRPVAEKYLRAEANKISEGVSQGRFTGDGGMTLECSVYGLPKITDDKDDDDEAEVIVDQSLNWDVRSGFVEHRNDSGLSIKELRELLAHR